MRLLRAELRKLRRPLTFWTFAAIVVLVSLFAWGGQKSAWDEVRFATSPAAAPPCEAFGAPPGPACEQAQRQWHAQRPIVIGDAAHAAQVRSSLGAGTMAADMTASLFGAVALLLFAAGHVGNEWSGRTIKQVFTQEGRRWRVLVAKLVSLILAGVAMLLVLWAVLAVLAPIFDAAYPLPASASASAGAALHASLSAAWHALLPIAAFAALGTLAAVVTRNTLGAFFLAFAFVIAMFIVSSFRAVARFTLAYWVTGWMRFHEQGNVPTHVWRDVFSPATPPTVAIGLTGLAVFVMVCVGLAWLRIERSDVKV